jgi:hypothetical protein
LYPDGQAVRMLAMYGFACGGDGYFLYQASSLSGPQARERVLGATQALLEQRALLSLLPARRGPVEYFQASNEVFGSVLRSGEHDVICLFRADTSTHYHPGARRTPVPLGTVARLKGYRMLYEHTLLSTSRVDGTVQVSQDCPAILIGARGRAAEPPPPSSESLALYVRVLRERADVLAQNIKRVGQVAVPDMARVEATTDPRPEARALLQRLADLDELKRNAWLERTRTLPVDGETLNRGFYRKERVEVKSSDNFNFYWRRAS